MMNHIEALYGIEVEENVVEIIEENDAFENVVPHKEITVETVVGVNQVKRVFRDPLDAASFVDAMMKKFENNIPLVAVYNEKERSVLMIPVATF